MSAANNRSIPIPEGAKGAAAALAAFGSIWLPKPNGTEGAAAATPLAPPLGVFLKL